MTPTPTQYVALAVLAIAALVLVVRTVRWIRRNPDKCHMCGKIGEGFICHDCDRGSWQ